MGGLGGGEVGREERSDELAYTLTQPSPAHLPVAVGSF